MGTQEDIYDLLKKIQDDVTRIPDLIRLSPNQIVIVHGLSDISDALGTVVAGEFRAGNQKNPGDNFSGMRMAYPPLYYSSDYWNLVGVENDVMQFGVNAADGKLYAGGGAIVLQSDGLHLRTADTTTASMLFDAFPYEDTEDRIGSIIATHASGVNVLTIGVRQNPSYPSSYVRLSSANSWLQVVSCAAGTGYMQFTSISPSGLIAYFDGSVRVSDHVVIGSTSLNAWEPSGVLALTEMASPPGTPQSGLAYLYVKTDCNLYFKNDAGTEYQLTPVPTT